MNDLMNNIMALQTAFQQVQNLAEGPGATKLIALKPLLESSSLELEKEFNRILRILQPGLGQKTKKKLLRQRLKWPFQKADVEQILQLLERHKSALTFAMNSDQMYEPIYLFLVPIVYTNIYIL